ncbi:unnamed protein product [Clavelina lepadiformis]|uniref:Uncharacterized protein n=1 Tax=Clavelina lepadiformis TaxID=159417 RepID=A0ABP0FND3_CLALP
MVVRLRMNLPIIVGQADKGLQLNVQIKNAQSECEKCDDPQAAPKLSSNDWDENRNLTSSTKKRKSCRSGSDGAEHDVMESSCHESNNNEDKSLEIAT